MYPEMLAFIDVETPNKFNNRICSIGINQTDKFGTLIDSKYLLVNPEAKFDDICMRIHGISPIDVKDAITFPELWNKYLEHVFSTSIIVAHNARFDLSAIYKAVRDYKLVIPKIEYIDTIEVAENSNINFASKKLNDICATLQINLEDHHKADSDAYACMSIYWKLVKENNIDPIVREFEFHRTRRIDQKVEHKYSDSTRKMQQLKLMIEESVADSKIETDEAMDILNFIESDEQLRNDPSISTLTDVLQKCLTDGYIDEEESNHLMKVFNNAVDPVSKSNADIEFANKNFILSGDFGHGSKASVESLITAKGGMILKSVTKKCNYVVVGGQGSEAYAMGNYGTKVKKALDWQAKGIPVQIVSEEDLFNCL